MLLLLKSRPGLVNPSQSFSVKMLSPLHSAVVGSCNTRKGLEQLFFNIWFNWQGRDQVQTSTSRSLELNGAIRIKTRLSSFLWARKVSSGHENRELYKVRKKNLEFFLEMINLTTRTTNHLFPGFHKPIMEFAGSLNITNSAAIHQLDVSGQDLYVQPTLRLRSNHPEGEN